MRVLWRYCRRLLHRWRSVAEITRGGDDRLPGDQGDIDWICPSCHGVQNGRPEGGCSLCGAGTPGTTGPMKEPTLEQLGGVPHGHGEERSTMVGKIREPGWSVKPAGSLAERILATAGQPAPPEALLDSIRMIVREEVADARTGIQLTRAERQIVLEGLTVVRHHLNYLEEIKDPARGEYLSNEEFDALYHKMQGPVG